MDGQQREISIEIAAVVVVAILAFLGLWTNPIWLVVGLVLHGIWDSISTLTQLTSGYPRFA